MRLKSIREPHPVFDREGQFVFLRQARTGSRAIVASIGERAVVSFESEKLWRKLRRRFESKRFDPFRFTVVRNPYSRAVSQWSYLMQRDVVPKVSFEEFTIEWMPRGRSFNHHLHSQVEIADGADFVGRFERINDDWESIRAICGLSRNLHLQQDHRSSPPGDWRDHSTTGACKQVGKTYGEDLDAFGYSFVR